MKRIRAASMVPDQDAGMPPAMGALRAFSRPVHDSSMLAITGRADFCEASGDKLAGIWWFEDPQIALDLEAEVGRLLAAAHFHINREGFSSFPAGKAGNLVRTAMTHLGVTPSMRIAPRQESKAWTPRRIGRLGFLMGQGLEAKQIARDPEIDTTPENVHRQASRFGLSFLDAPRRQVAFQLPREDFLALDRVARAHGYTPCALAACMAKQAEELAAIVFNEKC